LFLPNDAEFKMEAMQWSAALALDLPEMDHTHQEFAELLAVVQRAPDATVTAAWTDLIAHTARHFAQEDRWMRDTRFASSNCHSTQHEVVLRVMHEGELAGQAGAHGVVRQMAGELATWFTQHTQSYDPSTGEVMMPSALPRSEIRGCGSAECAPVDALSVT
jgi:hemerythrin-like metal-binding protein